MEITAKDYEQQVHKIEKEKIKDSLVKAIQQSELEKVIKLSSNSVSINLKEE